MEEKERDELRGSLCKKPIEVVVAAGPWQSWGGGRPFLGDSKEAFTAPGYAGCTPASKAAVREKAAVLGRCMCV